MLPTIPFKRANPTTHKPKTHTNQSSGLAKSSAKKRRLFSSPWVIIVMVLVIAALGIAIIRYSRASSGVINTIPQNLIDIQNYVSSLEIKSVGTKNISGNVEFRYSPTTDQAVKTVAYYIDNQLIKTTTKSPYSTTINTEYFSNGEHQLTVIAFSASDVPIAAKSQQINIQNTNDLLQSTKKVIVYPWHWLLNL